MLEYFSSLSLSAILKYALSFTVMITFALPILLSLWWQFYPDHSNLSGDLELSFMSPFQEDCFNQSQHPIPLMTFDNEDSFTHIQKTVYDAAKSSIDEFQHLTGKVSPFLWNQVTNESEFHLETSLLDDSMLNSSNPCNYIQRSFFDIHSNKDIQEIYHYLNTWQGFSLLALPKAKYPVSVPIHAVEWYNGSIDIIHIPLFSLLPWSRRELIAFRVLDKKSHIYTVKSLFPNDLLKEMLISHALSHDQYDKEIIENFLHLSSRYVQLSFGIHFEPFVMKESESIFTKNNDPRKYHYHVTILRYSNVLSSFPLLKRLLHDRYFLSYAAKKLSADLG